MAQLRYRKFPVWHTTISTEMSECMREKVMWQRPLTNKIYLHRPLSERLIMMCPDMKILNSCLLDNGTHVGQPGIGFILLHGEKMEGFDLDKTDFTPPIPGIPIYEMINEEECTVHLEAFAGGGRNPKVYFKITLFNNRDCKVKSSLGIMVRSGSEKYMLNQHQEGYSPYSPNYKNWFLLKRTWCESGKGKAKSGTATIKIEGDVSFVKGDIEGYSFYPSDYFKIDYSLMPGESISYTGAICENGDIESFSYEEERKKAVSFWEDIKAGIKTLPDAEGKYLDVFYHMAMQLMQMLAHYEGSDLVTVRQGDVGRFVWPYEGAQVISMLDRIGLSDYTFEACRYYCERWLLMDGPDKGKIGSTAGWENFTGAVIWAISTHLLATKEKSEFDYFLPHLISMRDWIERKRSAERSGGYYGIFPPGKGSDWNDVAQFWTFTDSYNVKALSFMVEALGVFGHGEYEKTKAIYESYSKAIFDIRDSLWKGHEDDEEYIFPHELGIDFCDSHTYSYYTDGAPFLLYTGFIEPGSKMMKQMENYFLKRGQFEKGLTGRMTSCESMWDEAYFGGYGDVWYTMQSETYWLKAWVASGEREKAFHTLSAMMHYGMTSEMVVSERYCSINPRYCPWQPNGSGSARMMEMLLEYFGEVKG